MTPARHWERQEQTSLPPISPLALQQRKQRTKSAKNWSSSHELAGLNVTAKKRCRDQSQSRHSHLDSCTDLGKTAPIPVSQSQSFSSPFGGLAGRLAWLLSQRRVFHLQLDSEQIPTTKNWEQSEGRKACISSPLVPSLSVCHESTLCLLNREVQHDLFYHFYSFGVAD